MSGIPINVGAIGPNPPTDDIGTSDEVLASIALGDLTLPAGTAPVGKRHLRFRRHTVEAHGIVSVHSHINRPAIIYVLEGEITEYTNKNNAPKTYKPGGIVSEFGDLWHWWQAGAKNVVLLVADLADVRTCKDGEC